MSENLTPRQKTLLKLAYEYDCNIKVLTERINFVRCEAAKHNTCNLRMRLDLLYAERRDMRKIAARLKRLAEPLTPSPSLLQREREEYYRLRGSHPTRGA